MDEFYTNIDHEPDRIFEKFDKLIYLTDWKGLKAYFNEFQFKSILDKNWAALHLNKIPYLDGLELQKIFIEKKNDGFFILIFNREDFIEAFQKNGTQCSLDLYPVQQNKSTLKLSPNSFTGLDNSISILLDFFYENDTNYENGVLSLRPEYIKKLAREIRRSIQQLIDTLNEIPNDARLFELAFLIEKIDFSYGLKPKFVLHPTHEAIDTDKEQIKNMNEVVLVPMNLAEISMTNDVDKMISEIKQLVASFLQNHMQNEL